MAKTIASKSVSNGLGVIVYDPTAAAGGPGANGWPASMVYTDWPRFVKAYWASERCLVIIDEAATVCDDPKARIELRAMMAKGRHRGHINMLIGQRHKRLDKTARDQCSILYAFVVDRDDAAELALDWNCERLRTLHELRPLHFVHLQRHEPPTDGLLRL